MMEQKWIGSILTSLLIIFNSVGEADIVTGPKSRTIMIGASAYFNCSTTLSEEIQWFHFALGMTDRAFVYAYGKVHPPYEGRFEIEKNETEYNLIIPAAKFEDAGKYECQDNRGGGDKKSAQLTVLEQEPICQSSKNIDKIIGPNTCGIEPDVLVLTCTIQYRGNEVPILEWRNRGTNDVISKGTSTGFTDNYVTLNLTMTDDPSMDGISYICQTVISTPNPYSCNVGPIKVLGTSNTYCNSHLIAIICIIVVLSGCVILFAIVLWWKYLRNRKAEKGKRENDTTRKPEELIPLQETKEETHSNARLDRPKNDKKLGPNEEQLKRLDTTQDLLMKLRETEQRLYNPDSENICYLEKSQLIIEFKPEKSDAKVRPICGIAIVNPNLFVVFENSQEIDVYDSVTFNPQPKCIVKEIANPMDITSSKANQCFYLYSIIIDNDDPEGKIFKIDPKGNVVTQWSTEGGPARLSTSESSVIACFSEKKYICEYSADGDVLQRISLSPAEKIYRPWHAMKVTNMYYVVSHAGIEADTSRLCVVDCKGKKIKYYSNSSEKLNVPISIAENSDKCVIVADRENKQISLLNFELKFKRKLLTEKSGLKGHPVRLVIDDSGNLFIAENILQNKEWQGARISILSIMHK